MAKLLISLIAICSLLLMASCEKSACENTNSTFNNFSPAAEEYKAELVRQCANVDKAHIKYWMDSYQDSNGSKNILADITGPGFCAKIFFAVKNSEKGIEELLRKKGIGYRGSELQNLKFDIKKIGSSYEFVFVEVSGIAD